MTEQKTENIDAPANEEIQNVGELLRNARLKSGKTISDAATELCIRRTYLEAIERVEYNKLPPEPYGLGYVRNYANYLGLNSARIVQLFRETACPDTENKKHQHHALKNSDTLKPKPLHFIVSIAGLAALYLCWILYFAQDKTIPLTETDMSVNTVIPEPVIIDEERSETTEELDVPATADVQDVVTEEQVSDNAENETEEQTELQTLPENQSLSEVNNEVKIVCTGDSWIEVKHQDKTVLAGVYKKGFEYIIPFEEDVTVSIGKRKNVQFYVDGKLTNVIGNGKQTKINLDRFLKKR